MPEYTPPIHGCHALVTSIGKKPMIGAQDSRMKKVNLRYSDGKGMARYFLFKETLIKSDLAEK